MPDTKNPKGIVGYRVMTDVNARCGICAFWDPDESVCQIVGGEIEEDCVCNLFAGRRPNLLAGNPRYLMPPTSTSLIPPLEVPNLYRSADVRSGFVRKGVHGGFTLDADDDSNPAWLQAMIALAAEATGLDDFDGLVDKRAPGDPLLDLVVSGEDCQLVAHSPYRMEFGVMKQAEEQRYTLGPLYLPDTLDAHGDFVEPDTLQLAAQNYVRRAIATGSNTIYDQHSDAPAGEWVDIVTWPFEQTVKMTVPGRGEVERTFPPGTVYQGVIWSPSVWPQVKSGDKRGLSMGGLAVPSSVSF